MTHVLLFVMYRVVLSVDRTVSVFKPLNVQIIVTFSKKIPYQVIWEMKFNSFMSILTSALMEVKAYRKFR